MQIKEEKYSRVFEYILTHYRGVFAVLILLPISVAYGAWVAVRNRLMFRLNTAPALHEKRVRAVIEQVQDWKNGGCKERLCTARSGWRSMSEMVPKYKLSHRNIRVDMPDILRIDPERQTVTVEPLVTMGQLSRDLISKGWILAVVPELDDLTVGGLIMGFGVETSSHKYGLIQHICVAFDLVTADGKLLHCSESENTELFRLIPWSHGTLGFLVAAELRIIPARQYVRVTYKPVAGLDQIVADFERSARNTEGTDLVEGIVYSLDRAVIMEGVFVDQPGSDGPVNPIGRWYKPWFYEHARTYLEKGNGGVEYIPLRHYLHRHTRGYFWTMAEIIPFGNHPLFRALLGWALPPRIELLKYTETETTRRLRESFHVVQDMLMPIRYLKESLQYFHEYFELYPLWLSPMAIFDNAEKMGLVHPFRVADGSVDPLYVDIGAYGTAMKRPFDGKDALPELEKFVLDHAGYQALYAKTALSREDFRRMFDHSDYDRLRDELPHCKAAFDEIYAKVSSLGRVAPVEMKRLQASGKEKGRAGLAD